MESFAHRLAKALDSAGRGAFPDADGAVEVLSPPPGRAMAVVAFTAHYMAALGDKLGRHGDGIDLLLAARGLQGRSTLRETAPSAAKSSSSHTPREPPDPLARQSDEEPSGSAPQGNLLVASLGVVQPVRR